MHHRNPNTECSVCGKPLYRRPCDFKAGQQFCCKGCRSELYKRKTNIWKNNLSQGWGWNKGMSKENGDKLIYGKPRSDETKQKISDALTGRDFSDQHRQHLAAAMVERRGSQKKTDTDIERILKGWLTENNIDFKRNEPIEGITNPDFFIEPNICLYADGDYWHNLKKVRERDEIINAKLEKLGYMAIRLLGSDIKEGIRPIELL